MSDRVETFVNEFSEAIDAHRRFAADASAIAAAKREATQLASTLDRLTLSQGAPRSVTPQDLRALADELSTQSPPSLEPLATNARALLQLVADGILDGDADGLQRLLSEADTLSTNRGRLRDSQATRLDAPTRATCVQCDEVVAGHKEGVVRWDSLQNKIREHERDRHGGYSDELRDELSRCRQALRDGEKELSASHYPHHGRVTRLQRRVCQNVFVLPPSHLATTLNALFGSRRPGCQQRCVTAHDYRSVATRAITMTGEGDGDVQTRAFELATWQAEAVSAWERGSAGSSHTGTLEVFTGGGKTLIALACAERASVVANDLRLVVVVPTEALARQWIESLVTYSHLRRDEIGLMGAGGHDSLEDHRALVAVLNSAAKSLPDSVSPGLSADLLLVVDECHRAGAPTFSRVLTTPARFRLGLSATPDREEVDDDGEPLTFDEQLVGRLLGPVVFRFSLKDAREVGWLPDYEIHHHAIGLHEDERRRYDEISRKIDDLADEMSMLGVDASQARTAARRQDEAGRAAAAWVAATARRKDLLYRAVERRRVASAIVLHALAERPGARALLFHERVDEASELHSDLVAALPDTEVVVEHSRLPQHERRQALQRFRDGDAPILVSVRSLIEGIDVPEADTGVSVASSSSVRQRVQSLGRVLRQSRVEGETKLAVMHVLYVRESVDDLIYAKEDWSDLTGEAANIYWSWPLDPAEPPERLSGPPHTPLPTEEQEWERIGLAAPSEPVRWLGQWPWAEYAVDTRGTVRNRSGHVVDNPQNAAALVSSVRDRPGGRFGVTPLHRIVVVRSTEPPRELFAVGCLAEAFSLRDAETGEAVDLSTLEPGHEYSGATQPAGGKFKLGQKRGGVIERRTKAGAQFALTSGSSTPDLELNARAVLAAWRAVATTGMQFIVTESQDAVYWDGGTPRFLAHVPGGFAWPEHEPDTTN